MNKFYVLANPTKDPGGEVSRGIRDYLLERKCDCVIGEPSEPGSGNFRFTDPAKIPEGTECIIVLGGDGTLIQAAVDVETLQIPLLGINLGTLGYLVEIDQAAIYPALAAVVEDDFQIEERMMLRGDIYIDGEKKGSNIALNEVTVTREGTMHMMQMKTYVNDTLLNVCRADGMIIATPTGSTGYSLSAGGPIIAPQAALFVMTPLAAHTLNTRSVVLPESDRIAVEIGPGRDDTTEHAVVYFDGASSVQIETGDRVEIRRAEHSARIIRINQDSFMDTLRRKMSAI